MTAETDVAAVVVAYLRDLGWDVHQEVGGAYGPRADIVAVRGPLLYVVEVKTTLGLAVLGQAYAWLHQASYVSVAVPHARRSAERNCAEHILRDWGVGLFIVSQIGESRVHQDVAPRLFRRIPAGRTAHLRGMLCDGTRRFASAGNAEGKFWSPFKATLEEVRRALTDRPGLTTKELIDAISHHYSSDATARSSLLKWLRWGKIPGVYSEGERPMRWYLAGATVAASPSSP